MCIRDRDDSLFVGKKVTNERAMRTLKGPKGSRVKLGIKRTGEKDLLHFNITRGDIPQNTVDAAYIISPSMKNAGMSGAHLSPDISSRKTSDKPNGSTGCHLADTEPELSLIHI